MFRLGVDVDDSMMMFNDDFLCLKVNLGCQNKSIFHPRLQYTV